METGVTAELLCDCEADLVDLIRRDAVPIPAYPSVALRISQLTATEDFDFSELTDLVSADQAVAAAILRSANSAAFASGAPVASVRAAVGRLGATQVARLALAAGLSLLGAAEGPLAPIRRRIWQGALASAVLCHHLARGQGVPPEEAFSAGLLHDLGKLLGAAAVEVVLRGRGEARAFPTATWLELLERYHVELGLVAAARWGLPEPLTEVISTHHLEGAGAAPVPLVAVVRAADHLVDLLGRLLHVAPAHLGNLPVPLSEEARQRLAAFLPEVPAFLASFETELAGGSTAPLARVLEPVVAEAPPPPAAPPVLRELALKVQVVGRHALTFEARHATPDHLALFGPAPLAENYLVQLLVEAQEPFTLWGTVKSCRPEAGGYALEVAPMALNGPTLARWIALVHHGA